MSSLRKLSEHYYSVDEYLKIDRATDERFEYCEGQIHMMAGESGAHGDISMNLASEFRAQLKGKECRARVKDTKVQSGSISKGDQVMKGMFSYPDIVVICGEPQYHDKVRDIVLNPKVIIEVLSSSTELYDRTDKFGLYRMFYSTLTDYILVSQDQPVVEHYIREEDNNWKLYTYAGLDKILSISSIDCAINLTEIYDRIEFSNDAMNSLAESIYL